MHCVCGYAIRRVELPSDLRALSGRQFILVHIESSDTHCYPNADNEADRRATAEVDTSYPEEESVPLAERGTYGFCRICQKYGYANEHCACRTETEQTQSDFSVGDSAD
jgi:hypothetical protein